MKLAIAALAITATLQAEVTDVSNLIAADMLFCVPVYDITNKAKFSPLSEMQQRTGVLTFGVDEAGERLSKKFHYKLTNDSGYMIYTGEEEIRLSIKRTNKLGNIPGKYNVFAIFDDGAGIQYKCTTHVRGDNYEK